MIVEGDFFARMGLVPQAVSVDDYLSDKESDYIAPIASFEQHLRAPPERPRGYAYPWFDPEAFQMSEGEVTIWTGYTKHGKTTALQQAILHAVRQGASAGIVSMEMPMLVTASQLLQQWSASKKPTREHVDNFIQQSIFVYDSDRQTLDPLRVCAIVYAMAKKLGCDVVMIDNLMTIDIAVDGPSYLTEQKQFAHRLLALAYKFKIHIHLVCHARKPSGPSDRPPGIYDVSGSANLVNMVHNVVRLWRAPKDAGHDASLGVLANRSEGFTTELDLSFSQHARQFFSPGSMPKGTL
jgi:hypothetical protein